MPISLNATKNMLENESFLWKIFFDFFGSSLERTLRRSSSLPLRAATLRANAKPIMLRAITLLDEGQAQDYSNWIQSHALRSRSNRIDG